MSASALPTPELSPREWRLPSSPTTAPPSTPATPPLPPRPCAHPPPPQPSKGSTLMGKTPQRGLTHPGQHVLKGGTARQVVTGHHRVHKKAQQRFQFRARPIGHRRSHHQIPLPTQPPQPHRERRQQ